MVLRGAVLAGALVFLLTSMACGSPEAVEEVERPLLRTESEGFQLQDAGDGWMTVQIPYVYLNESSDTVYLAGCEDGTPPSLQRHEDGEWVVRWSPFVFGCLSPPVVVLPGSEYRDTLVVHAGEFGSNNAPQFGVSDIDGTYRLLLTSAFTSYFADGPPWGPEVPLRRRVSNSFELRAP